MADLWGSIKNIVGKVAPLLGNAILPGVGGAAGSILAEALGVENTSEAIDARVQNLTAEDVLKIKEAASKHEERLLEIAAERDKLYLADTASARWREVELTKATGKREYNLYVLAWTVVVGFFALMGMMMRAEMPQVNVGPINQLFGALAAGFGLVLGYFFGSSKGSADKNAIIEELKK